MKNTAKRVVQVNTHLGITLECGNAAYLNRHQLFCHGKGILNMFTLESSGDKIR